MTQSTKTTHAKSKHATATTNEETTMTPKNTTKAHETTAHTTSQETTMTPKKKTKAHKTTAPTTRQETTTMNANAQTTINAAESTTPETAAVSPSPVTTATASAPTSAGLAALVTALSAALDDAEAKLGPEAPAITTMEKKRTAKPRKGSDKVLQQMAPIVEQYKLNSESLNTTSMLAQHATAQTLLPLQARLQKVTKRVNDEVFNAQTGSWETGLQLYGLLQRRAKSDGAVAESIAPLVKVFSYRHPAAQKTTKETNRLTAKLKKAMAVAQKHGVSVTLAPGGGVQAVKGEPDAVAAAQAELAAQGVAVGAIAATQGGAAPSTGSAAAATQVPATSGAPAPATAAAAIAPAATAPVGAGH